MLRLNLYLFFSLCLLSHPFSAYAATWVDEGVVNYVPCSGNACVTNGSVLGSGVTAPGLLNQTEPNEIITATNGDTYYGSYPYNTFSVNAAGSIFFSGIFSYATSAGHYELLETVGGVSIAGSDLETTVLANSTSKARYPTLAAALYSSGSVPLYVDAPVGSIEMLPDGGYGIVTENDHWCSSNTVMANSSPSIGGGGYYQYHGGVGADGCAMYQYSVANIWINPSAGAAPGPVGVSTIAGALGASGGGSVTSSFNTDLQNFIQDHPQLVTYPVLPSYVVLPSSNNSGSGGDALTDPQMYAIFSNISANTVKVVSSNNSVMTALQATPAMMGQVVSLCIGAASSFLFCFMVQRKL